MKRIKKVEVIDSGKPQGTFTNRRRWFISFASKRNRR